MGTPVNAKFKPWTIPGMLKPDALMISVVDFIRSRSLLDRVRKTGIREELDWDGLIVCDSGAFTALNSKKTFKITVDDVKVIYQDLFREDDQILKISLDFPTDKILENYKKLHSVEVQPAVPHDRLDILKEILMFNHDVEWIFIGRLVPLMRNGRNHLERLTLRLTKVKETIREFHSRGVSPKLWTLGLGAPSLLEYLITTVDGADSSRWRVSGSNMIILPHGGERGVGNITKWSATQRRIQEGNEKRQVLHILRELFSRCENLLDYVPRLKAIDKIPPEWVLHGPQDVQQSLTRHSVYTLLEKVLLAEPEEIHPLELEICLRASSRLRLLFNYHAILSKKMEKERKQHATVVEMDAQSLLVSK